MRKGSPDNLQITILHQFLAVKPHFVRKGCAGQEKSHFYNSFWQSNPFRVKGFAGQLGNRNFTTFYNSFWRSNHISCERVAPGQEKSHVYNSFWRSNLISCERIALRAVSLALPRAFKREIEKKERAREQEGKRECEDVKMSSCEDVKI